MRARLTGLLCCLLPPVLGVLPAASTRPFPWQQRLDPWQQWPWACSGPKLWASLVLAELSVLDKWHWRSQGDREEACRRGLLPLQYHSPPNARLLRVKD